MENALGQGAGSDAMGSLSLFDKDYDLCGESTEGVYTFPLKRIARVRSPYAEAILASFAAFLSRAALSHDFARSLWPSKPEENNA